jgi:hypothetical protein
MPRRKDDPEWQEKTDAQFDTAYAAVFDRIQRREAKFGCHHHHHEPAKYHVRDDDGKVLAGPFETEEEARTWMSRNDL